MIVIFIDIETTGLNYIKDEIITIQFQEGKDYLEILKSWVSDERTILESFVDRLEYMQRLDYVQCVGFNTMSFDIPFLVARCNRYNIRMPDELIEIFYKKLFHVDIKQIYLPYHKWRFKGLSWNFVLGSYGYSVKKGHGSQIPEWFLEGNYKKIIEYIYSEFPPMAEIFWKMRKGDIRFDKFDN